MHIKHILISGFRSFRSQQEIEQFSPKHNVIVGRNGSGKSNYFDAIQFALLGPKFANLRQEDRHHLLHEGAGQSVMAAYVEIVFDNSDGRLSVESDEVVIRRTIGHKKDEFFVNRKRVQKNEIQSLLESAGFSKSNPYYIVQQGKVSTLCLMKDTDRLNLLKDIAGTTVYEERRAESLRIMKDCTVKQNRITEVLEFIDERMTELEKEKEELHEYDRLDKQRRALEYNLFDKEMSKATEQLQAIEITRDDERERKQGLHSQLQEVQDQVQLHEDTLAALITSLERLEEKKRDKRKDLQVSQDKARDMQVAIQEAEASGRARTSEAQQLEEELRKINELATTARAQLEEVEPRFANLLTRRKETEDKLARTKARVEQLYGKQGRGKEFSSKAERNAFLDEQMAILDTQVDAKNSLLARAKQQIQDQEARLQKEGSAIAAAEKDAKTHSASHEDNNREIRDAIVKRNELQEQRKDSWRQMEELQEALNEARQELDRAKLNLNASLPKQVAVGLRVAERLAQEMQLEGYYGPLMNNFTLKSEAFRTAVEVAVGNSLFHVIVDTDKTAAMLIKEMEKRKEGRLTFIPLNRIQNSEVKYPDSNDVRPMMEVALEYDQAFAPAIKHVFGKKLLARDLEVASHFSREYNLDAITRDGDMVNRKGGFEGGYHDDRVSRIAAALKIQRSNAAIGDLTRREEDMKAGAENVEQAMNQIVRDLQKLEGERDRSKGLLEAIAKELGPRKSAVHAAADALEARKRNLVGVEDEVAALKEKREQFSLEKDAPLKDSLAAREKEELQRLTGQERGMQTDMEQLEAEMSSITLQRQKLRHALTDNFDRRRGEIDARLTSVRLAMDDEDVAESSSLRLERESTISLAKALESELDEAEAGLIAKRAEAQETQKKLESVRAEEERLSRSIDEAAKMHDKLMNKRTMLMETVQSKSRQIRDLGTLPRAEAEESRGMGEKQLLARIAAVQEALKKFPGVNRKALDQYVSFNEQRQALVERKDAAEAESESIQKLVDSLDVKKEEAILRTFKGVSHHFSEVFSELVKDGKGQLIMRTSDDEDEEGGEDLAALADSAQGQKGGAGEGGVEEEKQGSPAAAAAKQKKSSKSKKTADAVAATATGTATAPSISTFRGVQVRVSFSGAGQTFEMKQLSGGQKALVALALIFAIQRCDPAPFYLFDEIDQALDANYRAAVAHLIAKQASDPDNPAQFITTTFRPEMVDVAAKHYGIALVNKASNIYPLTKGDAQNFVTNMMLEEEKVGEVTSIARFDAASASAGAGPSVAASSHVSVPKEALDDDVDEDRVRGQYGVDEDSGDDEDEDEGRGAGAGAKSRVAAAIDKDMGVIMQEGGEGMDEEEEIDDLSEDEMLAGKGSAGARASKKRKARVRGSLRA